MTDFNPAFATVAEIAAALAAGRATAVGVAERTFACIDRLDGPLNAFNLVTADRAMAEAVAAEALLSTGRDLGPLHGIPYAVKDLFDVVGLPTTAGSRTSRRRARRRPRTFGRSGSWEPRLRV